MYINTKKKVPGKEKYEKKISDLHLDLEAAAKRLSEIQSELRHSLSEKRAAEESLASFKDQIENKKTELIDLSKKHQAHITTTSDLINDHNSFVSAKNDEILTLECEEKKLKQSIEALKSEGLLYGNLLSEIVEAKNTLRDLEQKAQQVESSSKHKLSELARVEENTRKLGIEVDEKIKKNGKILTETEMNLRTIEIYVKRLQRYYNERGLNINILDQFNIKRDTQ